MKRRSFNNKVFNKIQKINYILFLIMFTLNIVIIFNIDRINYYFLSTNFLILIVFYLLNKIYSIEYRKKEYELEKLLELDKDGHSWKKEDNIYKLFKRNYVQKNIIKKDYEKLELNFRKFIPESFINSISKWLNEDIDIGLSKEKDLHIMFIDISGFTKISEDLTAEKSLFLLNIYFDWIVDISRENWWYVDKFLWDGIMLIFDEKHSDNILKTSIEIRKLVNNLNIANFKHKITIWIWINSWKAILWTIGSKKRMDITIIWDSVNTASRIEHLTRDEENWILFSWETYNLIEKKENFDINKIWWRILKWKKEETILYWINEK